MTEMNAETIDKKSQEREESVLETVKNCFGFRRFDVEGVNVAGWIDREIVPFVLVVLAEKFAVERFEKVVLVDRSQAEIGQADAHTNGRTVRFRKERHELRRKKDRRHSRERRTSTNRCTIILQGFTPNFHMIVQLKGARERERVSEVQLEPSPEGCVDPSLPAGLD